MVIKIAAAGTIALTLLLAGCGSGTSGGSTTCGTWSGLNASDRTSAVTAMIKTHGNDESAGNVEETLGSVDLYCMVHPATATISGIYQG